MDQRAVKLALARKKLKDHQVKKISSTSKDEIISITQDHIQISQKCYGGDTNSENKNNGPNIERHDDQVSNEDMNQNSLNYKTDVNVTEILISNKSNMEREICELQSQLSNLKHDLAVETHEHNVSKQQIIALEANLKLVQQNLDMTVTENSHKDKTILDVCNQRDAVLEERNSLLEQTEFTKALLTSKENENTLLQTHLQNIQNQLEITQLQLQQLNNGSSGELILNKENKDDELLQKISSLEQHLKETNKEREQLNAHYENYIEELNAQLKTMVAKNDELTRDIQDLSNRENGLIEHISDMEIRLQNYSKKVVHEVEKEDNNELILLQQNYERVKGELQTVSANYASLHMQYLEREAKIKELSQVKEPVCNHDNISITKLNADITSDKIAAQRATEQNKKLKTDLQELEDAFVKMSQDKLELTEKLTAEKFLNRELTIKLADIDEKAKEMLIKLKAKDDEMIRLQTNYRQVEKEVADLSNQVKHFEETAPIAKTQENNVECKMSENDEAKVGMTEENQEQEHTPLINSDKETLSLPMEDAMLKLQNRFLKIMGEVADLADEKHRLEHIILQLQNETDTICEYVALYQQQRSLLKKRDEERSAQLKIFQAECDRLKSQLEELGAILLRFADDKELSNYFQNESRHNDITKVMTLLSNLKNNLLLDTDRKDLELKHFYPCNCCSGQLIDV